MQILHFLDEVGKDVCRKEREKEPTGRIAEETASGPYHRPPNRFYRGVVHGQQFGIKSKIDGVAY